MRRRLVTVYVTLLVAACLALAVPLCVSIAARGTSDMLLDRINDTARFAGLAEPSVLTGNAGTLSAELAAYEEVYGIVAVVVDRDGEVVASSRPGLSLADLDPDGWPEGGEAVPGPVRTALAGNRMGADSVVWPWQDGPLVVAEPIGRSGEVVGAAVTFSPTESLRRATTVQWGVAWLVVTALMLVGITAAGPLTRWILRPIDDLDEATRAVSGGSLDTRVRTAAGPEVCAVWASRSTRWPTPSPPCWRVSAPSSPTQATRCATPWPRCGSGWTGCPVTWVRRAHRTTVWPWTRSTD